MSDETTTSKMISPIPTKPAQTKRPSELVAALKKGLSSAEVFETFEALDALAPEAVRAALEPWTGPAPNADALDDPMRAAIGLPAKVPTFHCTRLRRPTRSDALSALDQEQIRRAGEGWDDRDLTAAARLGHEGSKDSSIGMVELISLSDASETARYDVVRFGAGSGTVFRAGTAEIAGRVADGVIEHPVREDRIALQNVLSSELVVKAPKVKAAIVEAATAKKAATAETTAKETAAPTKVAAKKTAAKTATATKKTAATKTATSKKAAAPKKATANKAVSSTKKAAAKKTVATKKAAKPIAKKTATSKKTTVKKAATTNKAATKKAATNKADAKKADAKKADAKKTTTAKKAATAKKTVKARSKAPAKKPATKAAAAKKGVAPKKAAAKKPVRRPAPSARKGSRAGKR